MFDEALTPEQLVVINALTEGLNSTDAAAQAGVHRNTIANWRRNSLFFRESLADAQYDRALLFRDKTEEMLDLAFQTLNSILGDPNASPSVRLKAALFIIEKGITPPQPRKQVPFDITNVRVHQEPVAAPAPAQNAQTVHKVHNDAQPEPAPAAPQAPIPAQTLHRETPKVGRNEPCPRGTPSGPGQNFKQGGPNNARTNPKAA